MNDMEAVQNDMESLWRKNIKIPKREPLPGDLRVEIAIIGAGLCGILTAYFLKEQGKDVTVLEADRIAGGQTGNTTAKITSQHGVLYHEMLQKIGKEQARLYAEANEKAIDEFEKIIRENNIDCHFKRVPSCLYSTRDKEKLLQEEKAAKSVGIKAHFTQETELPFRIEGAVCFENQAQFEPLLFVKKIAEKIKIYEQTKVLSVKKNTIYTDKGVVNAEKIIFATHYPIVNIPGIYFARQHQERSYVLALEGEIQPEGMYYCADEGGISLRSDGRILLLGGGAHRTGRRGKGGSYTYLESCAKAYYPACKEIARWSAQDCMTHDKIPFIGRYSYIRKDWYVATGFNKWGMTSSMLAAMLLCDKLCQKKNPYEELFSPQRLHVRMAAGRFCKDIAKSTEGLIRGALHMPLVKALKLKPGQAGIVRIGGRRYACYLDKEGKLHKIKARCRHMGCELQWNTEELSWDCPCHGSRFDYDGNLLDNPALDNFETDKDF